MKNLYLFFTGLFLLSGLIPAYSQNDTILIDFSVGSNFSEDPWNNFTSVDIGTQLFQLKNSKNLSTNMSVEIIDKFNGVNQNGTTTPEKTLGMPITATRDSYYGNIELWGGITEPTGGFQFSGLNVDKDYTFILFASRMGVSDNRETKYKFAGNVTDSVYLDPANNSGSTVSMSMKPKEDGTLSLILSPGENNTNEYHFFYFTALKILFEHEDPIPPALTIETPNGGEDWFEGSEQNITWSSVNLTEDILVAYSTDNGSAWINIDTVPFTQNTLLWTVPGSVSTQCLVKVSSGDTEDVSDGNFIISGTTNPAIKLIQPNGGEEWVSGSTQKIMWSPNKLTEDILAKYTTDNGLTWTSIDTVGPEESIIRWTLPEIFSSECLVVVVSGIFSDTSNSKFSIAEPICSNTIVVLGSSTAAGTGPSIIDSAWVWRYSAALKAINPDYQVINLSNGGYTTFQIVPTGTVFEPGITEFIDINRNITKALTYSPYAVIVNMPSNDANKGYTAAQTLANLEFVSGNASESGVKVWIATTQPRDFTDPVKRLVQKDLSVAIEEIFKEYSIDFWTGLADSDYFIVSAYNSGDGVHLNNAGHRILFERVMESQIHLEACLAEVSGVDEMLTGTNEINVYPNPARDEFTLAYKTESHASVDIRFFDLTGRELGISETQFVAAGSYNLVFSGKQLSPKGSMIIAVIKIKETRGTKEFRVKIAIMPGY